MPVSAVSGSRQIRKVSGPRYIQSIKLSSRLCDRMRSYFYCNKNSMDPKIACHLLTYRLVPRLTGSGQTKKCPPKRSFFGYLILWYTFRTRLGVLRPCGAITAYPETPVVCHGPCRDAERMRSIRVRTVEKSVPQHGSLSPRVTHTLTR